MINSVTGDHNSMKNNFFNDFIQQLYKKNLLDSRAGIGLVIVLVVAAFVVFEFRSPILLIPAMRDAAVKQLVTDTEHNHQLDIQQLWELRDRLGAKITYNQDYLEPHSILQFKAIPDATVQLLHYSGHNVVSTEYLVPATAQELPFEEKGTAIYQDDSTEITQDQAANTINIYTILSYADMKKQNGMIDYNQTKQDLASRKWVTITTFTVSPNFQIR